MPHMAVSDDDGVGDGDAISRSLLPQGHGADKVTKGTRCSSEQWQV